MYDYGSPPYHYGSQPTRPADWTRVVWSFLAGALGMYFATPLVADMSNTLHWGQGYNPLLVVIAAGGLLECGRRAYLQRAEEYRSKTRITARFNQGDDAYDWILFYLKHENAWKNAKDLQVVSQSSRKARRNYGCENVEYLPSNGIPQTWQWNGHQVEITHVGVTGSHYPYYCCPESSDGESACGVGCYSKAPGAGSVITVTMYTSAKDVLKNLVETARLKYLEKGRPSPHIVVHYTEPKYLNDSVTPPWNVTRKTLPPMSRSVIMDDLLVESLVEDAREFVGLEESYNDAGLPHRKGYLLHGPSGASSIKSAIYALAGELGMQVYALSLAAPFIDDNIFCKAAARVPGNSIFLIEDVDRATTGDAVNSNGISPLPVYGAPTGVTLEALLKVLDATGTEEGRLFFGTTDHFDRVDPNLICSGRFDATFEFKLTNQQQAASMFKAMYPAKTTKLSSTYRPPGSHVDMDFSIKEKQVAVEDRIAVLADTFAQHIPEDEFSRQELYGYLLSHRNQPLRAVDGVFGWVEKQHDLRAEKKRKVEAQLKERLAMQPAWAYSPAPGVPYGGESIYPEPKIPSEPLEPTSE